MKGEIDPYLWLLSILPDCSHECKNLMAAFSYWWLKCGDERSNLSRLRTLRNRSENTTEEKFRELVPKNDHFKNKDRQHPSAVLEPSKQNLIDELEQIGYVCQNRTWQVYARKSYRDDPITHMHCYCKLWVNSFPGIWCEVTYTFYKARLQSLIDKLILLIFHGAAMI